MAESRVDPRLKKDQLAVKRLKTVDQVIDVLGSKSYTNRYLAMASLSGRETTMSHALCSDDTVYLARALEQFDHVQVEIDTIAKTFHVKPTGRPMRAPADEIFVGGAGTPLRFLIAMAGHAPGTTLITGSKRMQERPMGSLLDALPALGVPAISINGTGCPPIQVTGGGFRGGRTTISGAISSQFTSSLLINAVRAEADVEVTISDDLISKPYVDMTVAALGERGVIVERDGYHWFRVPVGQEIRGGAATIEPDASGMSYFLAAAAILGGRVTIPGIGSGSVQGDVGLVDVLQRMGCRTEVTDTSITVEGGDLHGIEVDMESMPDVVPTLAIVAAYADGVTHISNIASLRIKECDRIAAVTTELRKMGITVDEHPDAMTITGGRPHDAEIDTYDDHRIAMTFAIAGLRTDGVVIRDPGCVAKSFPTFWSTLDRIFPDGVSTGE